MLINIIYDNYQNFQTESTFINIKFTVFFLYIWTDYIIVWAASSEFGTYRLCEQRRFRRACASAQACQNLRCSLTQAVNQEEPSDRKPDPWPLWMAGHAQLKFVMTECSKTQIRLTGPSVIHKKRWLIYNDKLYPIFSCAIKGRMHAQKFCINELSIMRIQNASVYFLANNFFFFIYT